MTSKKQSAESNMDKPVLQPKYYALTARAEIDGAVREPGYVFTLEDGKLGPHRTIGAHGSQPKDEPLYIEVEYPSVAGGKQEPGADMPVVEHGASVADLQKVGHANEGTG